VRPLLAREADWSGFLDRGVDEGFHRALQSSERTGRPLGSDGFVMGLEAALDRSLTPKKPGPKPTPQGS
jgi:putative transposase